jgi:hypothetical protein
VAPLGIHCHFRHMAGFMPFCLHSSKWKLQRKGLAYAGPTRGTQVYKGRRYDPPTKYGGCQIRAGAALPQNFCPRPGFFQTRPKTAARPAQKRKKLCSCIPEGPLTTNPILSALHLQGLKSNIYVHFLQVNKPLIGISFRK